MFIISESWQSIKNVGIGFDLSTSTNFNIPPYWLSLIVFWQEQSKYFWQLWYVKGEVFSSNFCFNLFFQIYFFAYFIYFFIYLFILFILFVNLFYTF